MLKISLPAQFFLSLLISLLVVFGLHLSVLHLRALPLFDALVGRSYSVNALLAVAIFMGLYLFRHRFRSQIGFLFMGGSLLKLGVFFWFFYPAYTADGTVSGLEFASFFIPYGVALVVETYFAIQLLNTLEAPSKKGTPKKLKQ